MDGTRIESASRDVLARIWRTSVGIVEQRSNLLDDMTVSDNVGLPLELGGARGAQVREAVDDALRSVGLESRSGSRAGDLSTGQQQLVADRYNRGNEYGAYALSTLLMATAARNIRAAASSSAACRATC